LNGPTLGVDSLGIDPPSGVFSLSTGCALAVLLLAIISFLSGVLESRVVLLGVLCLLLMVVSKGWGAVWTVFIEAEKKWKNE